MDLSGMSIEEIRELFTNLIASLKQIRTKRTETEKDIQKWEYRVTLAEKNDEPALKSEALNQVQIFNGILENLFAEEKENLKELELLKRELNTIKNQPTFSVNADLLLSQLEMIVGERDSLSEKIGEVEAQTALEQLKKEMDLSE